MKVKTVLLMILFGAAVVFFSHQYTSAQPAAPALNIGVVDIERVLMESKTAIENQRIIEEKDADITEELNDLSEEINEISGLLSLGAIRRESSTYWQQYEELLQKQAELEARQNYADQELAYQYHQMMENLYQKILDVTNELAGEKGIPLALAVEKPEFPTSSSDELLNTVLTHKVIYSGGCQDITDEVIARIDAGEQETEVAPTAVEDVNAID